MMAELAATRRYAILVTTHLVETVPALCSGALLLSDGRIARAWRKDELAGLTPAAFEESVMRLLTSSSAIA